MFSYYGSKSKIVQYYPSPTCDKIIEPFAGSARYSLRYFEKDILLVDKYKVIVDIWHYLQRASEKDILSLPTIKENDCVANYKSLSEIERKFVGFYIKTGQPTAAIKPSNRTIIHRPKLQDYQKQNIASNLYKIKHWKIIHGSYENLENENVTWFIDPPYEYGGHSYKESNKNLDFNSLANWCKSRNGQVIVCENTKATWMNFIPVIQMKGSRFKTTEAIWTNFPTQYDSVQQELFS